MAGEIFVVSAFGQGHLQPCTELCNHLLSRHYHSTIVIPSAIPSSFSQNSLSQTLQLTSSSGPPRPGPYPLSDQAAQDLHRHLAARSDNAPRHFCAVIDFQMGWTKEVFWKFEIPVVGFFTLGFGACAAAMEWGAWKVQAGDIRLGKIRPVPGLPEKMALTIFDLKRKAGGPPRGDLGGHHLAGEVKEVHLEEEEKEEEVRRKWGTGRRGFCRWKVLEVLRC